MYLDSSFFASGQADVALSRVKAASQLHFLAFDPVSTIKTIQHVRNLYGMTLPSTSGDVHFEPVHLPSLFKQCGSDGPSGSKISTSVPSFAMASELPSPKPCPAPQSSLDVLFSHPTYLFSMLRDLFLHKTSFHAFMTQCQDCFQNIASALSNLPVPNCSTQSTCAIQRSCRL